MPYYTYILRCADDSLYTGITTDLRRRFAQHSSGKRAMGAKYTASRPPVGFECAFQSDDRAAASRLEYRIKKLTRPQKIALIGGDAPASLELEGYIRVDIASDGTIKE